MSRRHPWIVMLAVSACLLLGAMHAPLSGAAQEKRVTERVSTGPSGGNGLFDVSRQGGHLGISADGSRSFFVTSEQLVPTDTDNEPDLYERSGGVTRLVSTGPVGGNGPYAPSGPRAMTPDGSRVLFITGEHLTSDDSDDRLDIYERDLVTGTTTLVSTGPAGGNGPFDAGFDCCIISNDGSRVTFVTAEQLTSDATRDIQNIYQRSGTTTTLLSRGPAVGTVSLIGASADGRRVFFDTYRGLLPQDQDRNSDVYKWEDGVLTLETPDTLIAVYNESINPDGTHLYFETFENLSPQDTDGWADIYERAGGVTRLVSTGPSAANDIGYFPVFEGASADGNRIFFGTYEPLVPEASRDRVFKTYERSNGTTTSLVLPTPPGGTGALIVGISADGSRVILQTSDRLTNDDNDSDSSIYERSNGTTSYLAKSASIAGLSTDASRVFIRTTDPLVPSDTDSGCNEYDPTGPGCYDFYELHGGQTTLVSTGPVGANGPNSVCETLPPTPDADYPSVSCPHALSADGTRFLFRTNERLVSSDTDNSWDVYLSKVVSEPRRGDYKSAGKFCRAERGFLGDAAFQQKYGGGRNAFSQCVRQNRRSKTHRHRADQDG